MTTQINFIAADKKTELQKDEFYDYCVTDLDTDKKFWTDDLSEAKSAAATVSLATVWDTNENKEVSK